MQTVKFRTLQAICFQRECMLYTFCMRVKKTRPSSHWLRSTSEIHLLHAGLVAALSQMTSSSWNVSTRISGVSIKLLLVTPQTRTLSKKFSFLQSVLGYNDMESLISRVLLRTLFHSQIYGLRYCIHFSKLEVYVCNSRNLYTPCTDKLQELIYCDSRNAVMVQGVWNSLKF